jgi:hypothetical protein
LLLPEVCLMNATTPAPKTPKYLTTGAFARTIERSERTVKFWCRRGWLKCQRPGGRYQIDPSEVARVLSGEPLADTQ